MGCWTAKNISDKILMKVVDELEVESKKEEPDIPKNWIISLFDREIIDLK